MILFVTASETAVLISAKSSRVGSIHDTKAAMTILAKLSFSELLSKMTIISFFSINNILHLLIDTDDLMKSGHIK